MDDLPNNMGFSGKIAQLFEKSRLTPVLALIGFLLGVFAALFTPREEEPQINVTMANIFIPFPGASVADIENLVSIPMEQVLGEIDGVDHIYSVSRPGIAILTVQYKVGVPRTEALVRLYNAIYSNQNWRPSNLGILPPLVSPKGIDDVPIVSLTLWTEDPERGAFDLKKIAHAMESDLKRIPGTRNIYTIGGPEQVVHVTLDLQKLAARGISISELRQALLSTNTANHANALIDNNNYIPIQAGEFLSNVNELSQLVIGLHEDKPIYLEDVATITEGPSENQNYVWYASGENSDKKVFNSPAVTIAISKKAGENAVTVANNIMTRVEQLKESLIPPDVKISITRNYGETANEKASTLIKKLIFATLSVILLVLFSLGRREALVVGTTVMLTLATTLFASMMLGFTLNRVSLFALIFSIGILVDDAIVIVENIHRHIVKGCKSVSEIIPISVDEVGGPTILATFTVIAALLPMAFVSGLMGPYMSPIPINASIGMLLSLSIALTFTPWFSSRIFKPHIIEGHSNATHEFLEKTFKKIMSPFLGEKNRVNRFKLGGSVIFLIFCAISLVPCKLVILKMLPFDNKSEFQVVVKMPEGSAVEDTNVLLEALTQYLVKIPEVTDVESYSGTASPINFNGLVRQYYLRQAANLGDLQINLKNKSHRKRSSHEIASSVRPALVKIAKAYNADIKIVEVPAGPPVLAPLVAEVYGPDYVGQIAQAKKLRHHFEQTKGVVDIDDSVETNAPRLIIAVDRNKARLLGISQADVTAAIATAIAGEDVTYLHTGHAKDPIPVHIDLPLPEKTSEKSFLALKIKNDDGKLIPLSEIVTIKPSHWEKSIYHKDLLPVVFVTGDMAGEIDSPLYGMFGMLDVLKKEIAQFFIRQPENIYNYSIKWDGEWQITYETFRDMGAAYSVGLVLIYLLVVAQFRSYVVPLIIMAPIPLTLIGILPGHALLKAQFTATSMIGMIALAGIIVRNSILLVDFINQAVEAGVPLETAVIEASAVRARPIILTALAAMMGAFFILDDPIFNGLSVSLIFGIFVSTILTLVLIPLLYYCLLFVRQKES